MNERIRELAEQAGITTNLETSYFERDSNKWMDYFAEKFAELIVRECADINFRHKIGLSSDEDYDVRTTILKHFGVEE
jgi:hypothetical protein